LKVSTPLRIKEKEASTEASAAESVVEQPRNLRAVRLVSSLATELEKARVRYCHWKSNEGLAIAPNGEIELDLLVGRGHVQTLSEVLARLGFKQARATRARQTPGVEDFYGMDDGSQRVVHVHAHYQLVLGDDTTRNFRLPVEEPYLDSAVLGDVLRIPSPEFEFVLFVIRMVLKHSTWDAIVSLRGSLSKTERRELESLESRVDTSTVRAILGEHLPFLAYATFARCSRALHPDCPIRQRMRAGRELHKSLAAHARRPRGIDTPLKLSRRGQWWVQRHLLKQFARKRLASGGALIAVVGGDGAGKSSTVGELCDWLSRYFVVDRVHLGKPPWSVTTAAIKGTIVAGRRLGGFSSTKVRPYLTIAATTPDRSPSRTWLLWHALTARDRYRAYVRARRLASNGRLVICDRFPLRQLSLMDGPASSWAPIWRDLDPVGERLVNLENRYYQNIKDPDVLIVLSIDPDIAVQRKTEEDPDFIRARCSEVANVNWEETRALVIDARHSQDEVLSEVKSAVWSRL
jgi:thymidylate kinase